MADEFDIEAMLEEPYKRQEKNGESERRKDRSDGDRERKRKRSKDRERKRSRSRDNESRHAAQKPRDCDGFDNRRGRRDGDRGRHVDRLDRYSRDTRDKGDGRDKNRDADRQAERPVERQSERPGDRQGDRQGDRYKDRGSRRSRSPEKRTSPSPQAPRDRRRFGRPMSISPVRQSEPELTPEERDARTVFCMQLAARIRPKDLEEFFSAVGQVRDVRLILDNKSHRSKGIAYIEFREVESVALAIALCGQRLLGVPIIVQPSHAERNRLASAQAAAMKANQTGPMRLYVGSLHYNITEEMLRGIFEPFGKIVDLKLMKDHQSGRSAGYGFITYHSAEDAKKAMDQLNGFELAGRSIKIGNVTDRTGDESGTVFDVDEMDRYGFGLGPTGRLQLMAKLAEGTGMQLPAAAANALNVPQPIPPVAPPPIATQCFMLSNMFDPARETSLNWETELRDDVIDECNKHGGVLHIYVDRASPEGNIYVKCPSLTAAAASVNALHGRYFAGKIITAAYVPLPNYHSLFPDSIRAIQFVMPSTLRASS